MIQLELPPDQANFVKIKQILLSVFLKYFRIIFMEHWNRQYPSHIWKSDIASGEILVAKMSDTVTNATDNEIEVKEMKTGIVEHWGIGTLLLIFSDSNLNLMNNCQVPRKSKDSCIPLFMKEEIQILKDIEKALFNSNVIKLYSATEFAKILMKLRCAARKMFNENVEREVIDIEDSQVQKKIEIKLNQITKNGNNHERSQSFGYLESKFFPFSRALIKTQESLGVV